MALILKLIFFSFGLLARVRLFLGVEQSQTVFLVSRAQNANLKSQLYCNDFGARCQQKGFPCG